MTDPISFTFRNEANNDAIIYTGVSTTLDVVLVNNTGADIALSASAPASFTLYLVSSVFSAAQVGNFGIQVAGWTPTINAATNPPTVKLVCSADQNWPSGASLVFPITGVLTTAAATPSVTVALVPKGIQARVPSQVNGRFAITPQPSPGHNLPLDAVLQASLDDQGLIYCSTGSDVLANRLSLTLKNIGELPIGAGPTLFGTPQVMVSFLYGDTGGSLTAAGADDPAWKINGLVDTQPPSAPWTPPGPPTADQNGLPEWQFAPSGGNTVVLDGCRTDSANVTFTFSPVVTNATAGHTQMFVLCTGFAKDANTKYDPHLYVLDVNKQPPPPTLGVLAFSSPSPLITVTDPTKKVEIALSWTTFGVDSVNLISSSPVKQTTTPAPTDDGLLCYGSTPIELNPPAISGPLFLTLQALDSTKNYLGAAQFAAFIQLNYVEDPDERVYPAALFGDCWWTLADWAYATAGSYVYNDPPNPPAGTPRLYTLDAARQAAPASWSLPTVDDWSALIACFGDAAAAYTALIAGGPSGFAAGLGGLRTGGSYLNQGGDGYYWTTSASTPMTQFSSYSSQVFAGVQGSGSGDALSVRYVRPA